MTGTHPLNEPNHLQTDIEDQLQEQPTRNKRLKDVLVHQASHLNHFISSAKVSAIMNTFRVQTYKLRFSPSSTPRMHTHCQEQRQYL
jgi:hypothetical protein